MASDKDRLRMDPEPLLEALRQAGAVVTGTGIKCPFHEDAHASGGVYRGEDGFWRFKCQAASCGFGGDVYDVRERAGGPSVNGQLRSMAPAAVEAKVEAPKKIFPSVEAIKAQMALMYRVEDVYLYEDQGRIDLGVIRLRDGEGKKTFRQFSPVPGGFACHAPPKPWPIFNREAVRAASEVIVVEGEKCVRALTEAGQVATTSPGGAGKASLADWSPLAGKIVCSRSHSFCFRPALLRIGEDKMKGGPERGFD